MKQTNIPHVKPSPVITIDVVFNSDNKKKYSYKAFRDMDIVEGDLVVVKTSTRDFPVLVTVVGVDTHSTKANSFILDSVGSKKMELRVANYEKLERKMNEIKAKKEEIIRKKMMETLAEEFPELADDIAEYKQLKEEFNL